MKPGDLVEYTTSNNELHLGVILDCYDKKIGAHSYTLTDIFIHGRVFSGVYADSSLIKQISDVYDKQG